MGDNETMDILDSATATASGNPERAKALALVDIARSLRELVEVIQRIDKNVREGE